VRSPPDDPGGRNVNPLGRLRGRSLRELGERAGQQVSTWLERRGYGDVGEPTGDRLSELIGDANAISSSDFFASFDDRTATLRALQDVDPSWTERLQAAADRLIDGRFDLLAFHDLRLTMPPDWHFEPVAGRQVAQRHWSEIDFLDPGVAGDHKVVWELGRHRSILTLAQAWWCTHDPRYLDATLALMSSWLDANPPKRGIHWASSLEIAFRSITWLWVMACLGDDMPLALRRRALGFLVVSGRHIERHLSTWFSPNTHLTGEALGLFTLGAALPSLPDAPRWRETGSRILLEWLPRHVRADGTYVEQSTWYHRYTVDFFTHFLVHSHRVARPVNDHVGPPLERMLEVLAWLTRPDGTMPLVGDDDGGRLMFLDDRTAHQTRTPLAIGAALFGRGDFAHVAVEPTAELVWMLGPAGVRAFRNVPREAPARTARAFVGGGLHIVRSGWSSDASVCTIDAGPHGFLNGGHAHADALSIDLTIDGQALFVDPGTFTYTTDLRWRDHFRETAWHNAATVDGCGSASAGGPFHWLNRAEARAEQWADGRDLVVFRGSHTGFERLAPPVHYERIVAFIPPSLWIVRDAIRTDGDHDLAAHWQCAVGVEVAQGEKDGVISLLRDDQPLAYMATSSAGRFEAREGWVSVTYGERHPAPHLSVVQRVRDRGWITTAIASAKAGTITALRESPQQVGSIIEIAWGHRRGTLRLDLLASNAAVTNDPIWVERDGQGPR
jgi:hypothetical protein